MQAQQRTLTETLLMLGTFGLVIAMGKLLTSNAKMTWKLVVGRAISTTALSLSAGVVLLFYPEAPTLALIGVGGLLGSLGTSGIQKLISVWKGAK